MIKTWEELKYWSTGEYDVVMERLEDLEKSGVRVNPARKDVFKALKATPLERVKVCFIGQDPYPEHLMATGIAFHTPSPRIPSSLQTLFKEYQSDLKLPPPKTGNLLPWCEQGVLLWNAIPSCEEGKSLSHDWEEYSWLTKEIVEVLSQRSVLFVSFGAVARRYTDVISRDLSDVLNYDHPSPRGQLFGNRPIRGSRLFSRINSVLVQEMSLDPINWRLDHVHNDGHNETREIQTGPAVLV